MQMEESEVKKIALLMQEKLEALAYLHRTDWCVTKCQEIGNATDKTYPEEHVQRVRARERINQIDAELLTIVNHT